MTPFCHSAQQVAYVTVRLVVSGSADLSETIENLDYSFSHSDVVDSEIVGYSDS
jgi:hypothetical protein